MDGRREDVFSNLWLTHGGKGYVNENIGCSVSSGAKLLTTKKMCNLRVSQVVHRQFEIDKGMTTTTSEICRIERCTATINYVISVRCFWFFGNVGNYVGIDSYRLLFVQIKSNIWSLEFCFCMYPVITFVCMWMDVEWILEFGNRQLAFTAIVHL
ncbi:uncharacterized protein LOC111396716 [Olea europaea var. sylvestris]|uniref:uncharacterized protein LOC111396716 n=1 Tax=Olea europaea var. sylvestris TaxID=158386 RepID=UPI000C1D470E|nr:uncharacterized protein LOC111396716 [Olea europaea var. sylvestris]